jgi:hypothetical protein
VFNFCGSLFKRGLNREGQDHDPALPGFALQNFYFTFQR